MRNQLPYQTRVGEKAPSLAVVEALATVEECDALDLDCVLHDAIDPDSLDLLFTADRMDDPDFDVTVEFEIAEYEVRVIGDGSVVVDRLHAPRNL